MLFCGGHLAGRCGFISSAFLWDVSDQQAPSPCFAQFLSQPLFSCPRGISLHLSCWHLKQYPQLTVEKLTGQEPSLAIPPGCLIQGCCKSVPWLWGHGHVLLSALPLDFLLLYPCLQAVSCVLCGVARTGGVARASQGCVHCRAAPCGSVLGCGKGDLSVQLVWSSP